MTLINLFGVEIVGVASVAFSVAVLAPVVLLIAICIPNINTSNWVKPAPNPDPVSWVNIALWNLNGWDAAAAIGDEVKDPGKNIPRALSLSMLLVVVPYILTILAATGVDADFGTYHNGRYNDIAEKQGGWIMGGLFALASVCSVMVTSHPQNPDPRLNLISHAHASNQIQKFWTKHVNDLPINLAGDVCL